MKLTSVFLAATAALAMSGTAFAQSYGYGYDRHDRGVRYAPAPVFAPVSAQRFDWAQVVRVDPIVSTYQQPILRDECWSQPVVYREPVRYHGGGSRDRAPAVIGAIVGGAIGNQFGSGRGRDAATVAGAALGYSAVRDTQRHGYVSGGHEYQVYEQRCAPRTTYMHDERISGYDVTYRYRGQIYRTTTDYHPGDRIQIRVDVRPVR
jgi:uncharacterized protein YcfJ